MSTIEELRRHIKSDSEIDRDYKFVQEVCGNYLDAVSEFIKQLTEDEATELAEYFRFFIRNHDKDNFFSNVGMNEVKTLFLLSSELSDADSIEKVLLYLESEEFGWHGDKYYLRNSCLRRFQDNPEGHCKKAETVQSTESASDILCDIGNIFLQKDVSSQILLIFNYCLASVFSSILNADGVSMPFFLQIAVDKTSAMYQLLKEIVEICDVNSGLFEKCNKAKSLYGKCDFAPQIYFPTQSTAKDIENLVSDFKDSPVLIIGYENERYYNNLLREVANIQTRRKALDLRNRFNLFPVFVCSTIKSSFDNVFSMDLTDLQVSTKYIDLIKKNKKMLASWVMEFVTNTDRHPFQQKEEFDKRRIARRGSLISSAIGPYINHVCLYHTSLTLNNAKNVAILNFFFQKYLNTFRMLCTFSHDESFEWCELGGKLLKQNIREILEFLTEKSERSLVELHQRYLPAPTVSSIKNKDAVSLAKQIEKHYRLLKVYIRVIPAEAKEDRFIFTVDTLFETKDTDVSKNVQTVQRRLKKYEWFRLDMRNPTSMRLIVAEKPLMDNSLLEILRHRSFAESKLQIPYAMGFDDTGAMCIEDIVDFPHLLLGGATRSGKSTAIVSLLMSIAYKQRTGNVNVMILDLLEKETSDFDIFNDQPFMSAPVISEPVVARKAIMLLCEEKNRRLKNGNMPDMPYIVCVIDEFPKLYAGIADKGDTARLQAAIDELLSSGRHSKVHLVLAAQDPVKASIKGSIANITARVALKCAHYKNSIAIIGRADAYKLAGRGQMIFDSTPERDRRLQGSYISSKDMRALLSEIRSTFSQQNKYPFKLNNLDSILSSVWSSGAISEAAPNSRMRLEDEKLVEAIVWVLKQRKVANYKLQDYCHIANPRANRLLNRMEEMGLIHKLHSNLGWRTVPKCFEDISTEVIDYLKECGVTESEIRNVFCGND